LVGRLLAAHAVPWAKKPVNLLPRSSLTPLPQTTAAKLHQRGDHVALTEDIAIAVHNMSSLLMHPMQQQLRCDCAAAMRSAALFFSSVDSDSAHNIASAMPHSLNALASLFPYGIIDTVLSMLPLQRAAPEADGVRVGALVTAKCPATKTFRVARVIQVIGHSAQLHFSMPDRSVVCASCPVKSLRAVRSRCAKAAASRTAALHDEQLAKNASSTTSSPCDPHLDDILSLCSLALLPSAFQDHNYEPLFKILLEVSKSPGHEFCALIAVNALVSNANFVARMCAVDSCWIAALAPIADILNRDKSVSDPCYHDAAVSAVVSIFDSLLCSASSADQRQSFIDVMFRARILHALFRFCQSRDSPHATGDTAACVLLSCAGVSPTAIAISWLKSSFHQPRRSGGNLLHNISALWTAHHAASNDYAGDETCVISVDRFNLIASSVRSFGYCTLEGLAKKLKVKFLLERGCDAGGLTVEWLHLLLDAVLSDFAFFLPVLLPNGLPSGVVRVNHSAALATDLPSLEVFRMVGCCLAMCLQVRRARSYSPADANACDTLTLS
jgi:hypothetical protein